MSKKSPIGVDNFGELANPENNFLFVDKTLFIKELIDKGVKVSLIIRPRRWGKTLNMSMLQHFFSPKINEHPTKHLFDKLNIAQIDNGHYLKLQGQHPTLFISFKDVKEDSYNNFINKIRSLIRKICNDFPELNNSQQLTDIDKIQFERLMSFNNDSQANDSELQDSLKIISSLLFKHYHKKVFILIDEYDTPLNAGSDKPHFEQMVDFFKGMFGAALKGNDALEKGIMTGILRLSKNKMLSDINNLVLYSFMEKQYSEHFGFFESEVKILFQESGIDANMKEIQRWYNGYRAGNFQELYNPWSILNCIQNEGELKSYWIKTVNEDLLKKVLLESSLEVKEKLNMLLTGTCIESIVDEYLSFDQIKNGNDEVLWSLLWALGYLKAVGEPERFGTRYKYQLKIPNEEIEASYRSVFHSFIHSLNKPSYYDSMIHHLVLGQVDKFSELLNEFMLSNTSYYDFSHESTYHTLLLALTASLKETHDIISNREMGLGRPDIVLVPRNLKKTCL